MSLDQEEGEVMASRSFTVIYEPAEGGGFYAHVPALDLTTEGRTLKEAKAMVRDALEGYLEAAKLLGKPVPADVTVERIKITA
jgi:predicted RNase H-like HicB family nuclease